MPLPKPFTSVLIVLPFVALSYFATAQDFGIAKSKEGLYLLEGADTVLFYRSAPASIDGKWSRANYIHPLYGMHGEVLTEDFPDDHPHHRGVFWAWHQVWVGDKRIGDPWECRDFEWNVRRAVLAASNDRFAVLEAEVYWQSPDFVNQKGKIVQIAREQVRIRVHRKERHFRVIDFDISIQPLVEGLRLGGSEDEKGYGGFSVRMKLPDDVVFQSSTGPVVPRVNAIEAGPWIDILGTVRRGRAKSGIVLLSHPENPGHPQPWILRSKDSMQNVAWPGREPETIQRGQPVQLRYRLVLHSGSLEPAVIENMYREYSADY